MLFVDGQYHFYFHSPFPYPWNQCGLVLANSITIVFHIIYCYICMQFSSFKTGNSEQGKLTNASIIYIYCNNITLYDLLGVI